MFEMSSEQIERVKLEKRDGLIFAAPSCRLEVNSRLRRWILLWWNHSLSFPRPTRLSTLRFSLCRIAHTCAFVLRLRKLTCRQVVSSSGIVSWFITTSSTFSTGLIDLTQTTWKKFTSSLSLRWNFFLNSLRLYETEDAQVTKKRSEFQINFTIFTKFAKTSESIENYTTDSFKGALFKNQDPSS